MNRISSSYSAYSNREQRLCFWGIDVPSSSPEPLLKGVSGWLTDWTKWTGEKGIDLGGQFKDGIAWAWKKDTRSEELKTAELLHAGEFFQHASKDMIALVKDAFDHCLRKGERPTLTDIAKLTSIGEWVEAFKDPTLFTDATRKEFTLLQGPKGLLWGIDQDARKLRFHDLVTEQLIAPGAQAEFEGIFGSLSLSKAEAAEYMTHPDNQATILTALEAMLGKDIPATEEKARQIATRALQFKYYDGKAAGSGGLMGNVAKEDLEQLTKTGSPITSVDDVRSRGGNSLLAGAAKLGVVSNADFDLLFEQSRLKAQRMREHGESDVRRLGELSGAVKKGLEKETKTWGEIWQQSEGFGKWSPLLAGLALFMFVPEGKKLLTLGFGTLTAYFFGAKYLAKIDNPMAPLERMADKAGGSLRGKVPDLLAPDSLQDADMRSLARREGIILSFMDQHLREDFDTASQTLMMLYDFPIDQIVNFLEIPEGTTFQPGIKARLKVWDPTFQHAVREHLKAKGMKPAMVSKIFGPTGEPAAGDRAPERAAQAKVAIDAGDLLSTLLYLKGGKPGDPRMSQVERIRKNKTITGSYDELPAGEVMLSDRERVDPRRLYCELRSEGVEHVRMHPGQTLGQFAAESMHLSEKPDREGREEIENGLLAKLKSEIEAYQFPAGTPAKLKVERGPTLVTVDVGDTKYPLPLTMSVEEFVKAKNGKEIIERWVQQAFVKKNEVMSVTRVIGGTNWNCKLEGEYVTMDSGCVDATGKTVGIAKSPVYKFLQLPIDEIRVKYCAWFDEHYLRATGVVVRAPVNLDPL